MRDPSGLARAILAADGPSAKPLLREAGFGDADEAGRILDRLSGQPPNLTPLPEEVLAAALTSGWPERALRHLERFAEAGGRASLYSRLQQSPMLRDGFLRVLANSGFLTDILVRSPEQLYWLFEGTPHLSRPLPRAELRAMLRQTLAGVDDDDAWAQGLRRFQRRELLRIGAAQILATKEVFQVGRELADLADVIVRAALERVTRSLRARYGQPLNRRGRPAQFAVVGLGKYGGRELNFSSDIDLLFVYDEEGQAAGDGGRGRTDSTDSSDGIDTRLFFDRLGEALIQALTQVTAEGFLYRVDMRLRPEGEPGPLTRSLRSYWIYYEMRGELWERQMLIKARHAAGSRPLWRRFRDMLVPFVYPAHFAVPPEAEIRRVKERIEAEIRQRPAGDNNIKLQAGGIRDIEFVVQCLQLLEGRRTERTRGVNTLTSIGRLRQSGVLADAEAEALARAYRFLRRLENLLQIDAGRPRYAVPDDDTDHARALSVALELEDRSLSAAVWEHLSAVRAVYDDVFRAGRGGDAAPDAGWLLTSPPPAPAAVEGLEGHGFREPDSSLRQLQQLGANPMMTGPGRAHLEALLPQLLPLLGATPDPDAALVRFARIVDAYGAAGAFFGMAGSHPRFLSMLVTLCGHSRLLAELIQHDPGLLDELVGLDLSGEASRLERRAGADHARLRRYRNSTLLRIGVDDLLGLTSSEETFHRISDLADEIVGVVVDATRASLARRWGRPRTGRSQQRASRFVCFAGGKAGGRELDFASDLDLFFVYEGQGRTGRGVDNGEFFSAAVRGIIQRLGDGLFEVDARLRPDGRSAPVVISLSGYRAYLQRRGATWERLALTRARAVAGDGELARRTTAAIEAFVYEPPLTAATVDEIVDMRLRMEPSPEQGKAPETDIKRGAGGIVDVEFIAQILVLHHGARCRELRQSSTRVVLERAVDAGLLSPEDGRALSTAYERLRQLQKALRLNSERSSHVLPGPAERTVLAHCVGAPDADHLTQEVVGLLGETRQRFLAVAERVRAQAAGH